MIRNIIKLFGLILCVIAVASFMNLDHASADTIEELKAKIEQTKNKRAEIEREISRYTEDLLETSAEAQSLQSAVNDLELTEKKLLAQLNNTQSKIRIAGLTIQELELEINDTQRKIENNTTAIKNSIRNIQIQEDRSLIEVFLSGNSLSEVWSQVDDLQRYQSQVKSKSEELALLKVDLSEKQLSEIDQKENLVEFTQDLSAQKEIIESNKQEKSELLSVTKNQEAEYQRLLAEKRRQKAQFEQSLRSFEAQLQIAIDPSRIPAAGQGILSWPLQDIFVTQRFGNTAFAQGGAYNGSGHNGVDFRAPVGTKVSSALGGTVRGTGNTDAENGCYSYGKWVLVEHTNGLSTMYAHLSQISVDPGQSVATGQTLGYSGNTGYSTGPHLHMSVYASQGVRIVKLGDVKASTNCPNSSIPVADLKAYLDPLTYL